VGAIDRRDGIWVRAELDRLASQRPGLHRALVAAWRRPAALFVPLGVLLGGLVAGVVSGDAEWFREAGSAMWGPGIWDTFAAPGLQIGPVYLLALGAVDRLASAVGLSGLWTITLLQAGGITWFALWTARRLARRIGVPELPVQWALGAVLVPSGYLAESVGAGHAEEVLLGLLLVNVAIDVGRGRWRVAGVLLGAAVGVKQWAVLGAGVLVHGRDLRGVVKAALVAAAVIALTYGPFFVWGDVRTFEFDWSTLVVVSPLAGLSGWTLRLVQGGLAGLAGVVVAWRGRSSVLVPVAVAIAVRLLVDPLRLPYYNAPLVLLALLWLWTSAAPALRRRAALLSVLAPLGVLVPHMVAGVLAWYLGTAVLLVLIAVMLRLDDPDGRRGGSRPVPGSRRGEQLAEPGPLVGPELRHG
jgi:hypothetical protein